jgi:RluA family pseudouridine synthase
MSRPLPRDAAAPFAPPGEAGVDPGPRRRFDPPVLRFRWTLEAEFSRAELVAGLEARTGWGPAPVARMLAHGGVHLDGYPHGGNDLPARLAAGTRVDLHALAWEPEPIEIGPERILAEHEDWLAVDKPAWLPVQPARASRRFALEPLLRARTGCAGLVAVHRLDRETSGVVLFARDARAAARLGAVFRERRVRKSYWALVAPPPVQTAFEVAGFLGRRLDPARYRFALRSSPAPGYRFSHTCIRLVDAAEGSALVAAEPVTGRTHQVRVHLEAAGTPIVGDSCYGGAPAPRLQLHARELAFSDRGREVVLRAPLPDDLEPAFHALAHS